MLLSHPHVQHPSFAFMCVCSCELSWVLLLLPFHISHIFSLTFSVAQRRENDEKEDPEKKFHSKRKKSELQMYEVSCVSELFIVIKSEKWSEMEAGGGWWKFTIFMLLMWIQTCTLQNEFFIAMESFIEEDFLFSFDSENNVQTYTFLYHTSKSSMLLILISIKTQSSSEWIYADDSSALEFHSHTHTRNFLSQGWGKWMNF